jgi:putative DNA primase/helicase
MNVVTVKTTADFSMLDHLDKFEPSGKKDKYICPVCGGNDLSINPKTGAYSCFSGGCESKAIRAAVAPIESAPKKAIRPKQERVWEYTDRSGNVLVKVHRTDDGTGKRDIWQKYPNGKPDQADIAPYQWAEVQAANVRDDHVLLVEGEPSVDALRSIGLTASCFLMAKYQNGDYSKDFEGAKLVICPDRDEPGIKQAGLIFDDYPDAQWLYADPTSQWWDRLPKSSGYDIADWIEDGATKADILGAIEGRRDLGDTSAEAQKPKPQSQYDGINVADLGEEQTYEMLVARHFEKVTGAPIEDWISVNGVLHQWTGTHFEAVADGVVAAKIHAFLEQLYVVKTRKVDRDYIEYPSYQFGSDRKARNALASIKTKTYVSPNDIARSGLNLKNGTLVVEEVLGVPQFRLMPHSKERIYLHCSPVEWNPNADTTYARQLLQAVDDEQLETFLRHQSMFLDYPGAVKRLARPRAGICIGEGSNGKDAIRATIEHLLGKIGNFSFEDFKAYEEGRRFNLATLPNYQYSWASENNHKLKLEKLKPLMTAITGEPLISERKGIDGEPFKPQLPLWFNLNNAPVTDNGNFIRTRFAVYPFSKTFDAVPTGGQLKADPRFATDLDFQINQVAPGLLVMLTQAFQRFWADGIDWAPCERHLQKWAIESNHLLQFADDLHLAVDPNGTIPINKLYDSLTDWYRTNEFLEVDGSGKHIYAEAPSHFDPLVKRSGALFKRLKELFPRIERCTDTDGSVTGYKGRGYVRGLAIAAIDTAPSPEPSPALEPQPEPEPIPTATVETSPVLEVEPEPTIPTMTAKTTPAAASQPDQRELQVGDRVWAWLEDAWHQAIVTTVPSDDKNPHHRRSFWKVRRDGSESENFVWDRSHLAPIVLEAAA